jgi:hypothetical protein
LEFLLSTSVQYLVASVSTGPAVIELLPTYFKMLMEGKIACPTSKGEIASPMVQQAAKERPR